MERYKVDAFMDLEDEVNEEGIEEVPEGQVNTIEEDQLVDRESQETGAFDEDQRGQSQKVFY